MMGVKVYYVTKDGEYADFSSMCFAQLGKGACYRKNPDHHKQYFDFVKKAELLSSGPSTSCSSDAMDWYIERDIAYIELRQEDAFSNQTYQQSWKSQSASLMKYLIEDSPFSCAYLSTYSDWVNGIVRVDVRTVTAEMTLHALQWFRLAGTAGQTFTMLQSVDSSNPWRNCCLSYLLPEIWRGSTAIHRDLSDNTLFPECINKRMFTEPATLYADRAIQLSVYDLWGYPMNLLKMWSGEHYLQPAIERSLRKHVKNKKIQGIFTSFTAQVIEDPKEFIKEFDLWLTK